MSSAAQDEFDALVADKARPSRHPADESDASSTGSTTLAPSSVAPTTSSAKPERPSIRGSLYSTPHGDPADGDSSDEDEARPRREPSTYYLPNYYTNDNMTGPKGVIADAQAFEKEKRGSRDHTWDEQNFERTRDLALPRTQRSNFDEAKRGSSSSANNRSASSLHKTLDNKEDADWEEEDEELQRWRTNRITQLKQSNGKTNVRRKKTFGRLKMVDGMGFLEAVEKSSRGAVVVVYIWNDESELSDAYAQHLSTLAAKHSDVQFVALHAEEAEIDSAGIPAILAYRNGDKFAGLVPLQDEVPFTCNVVTNLEETLKSHEILS